MDKKTHQIDLNKIGFADFHTHILPKMDDGSHGTLESVEMLCAMRDQGIRRVVATSHFYPETEDPHKFLSRRRVAIEALAKRIEESEHEGLPTVYAGAEVAYFDGISTSQMVGELCIEGTNLLLVEMPFRRWSHAVVEEICYLVENTEIRPVIAHIERHFPYCRNAMIKYLASKGVLIQSNASAFINKLTRHRAAKLVKEGVITLIGSDCHNLTDRAPNVDKGAEELVRLVGKERLVKLAELGQSVLDTATPIG